MDTPPLLTEWLTEVSRFIQRASQALGTRLGFGDGTDPDNVKGEWQTFTTHATPGTEFALAHTMGEVPVGFLVVVPPVSGTLNKGTTAWTTSNIYLTCTAASQSVKIFLLPISTYES
jgi:hypothetical protein